MKTLSYGYDISMFRLEKTISVKNKNLKAYFIHDYFPSRYQDVDDEIKRVRKLVYDFKDGRNSSWVALIIADAIKIKMLQLNNSCICIIPASTSYKTKNRYSEFCRDVASISGILNGYSFITNRVDREELKGKASGDKISTFEFHSNLYHGKTVLLFDDVYTSGTSFKQVAEKLITTGANDVIGIFLAKTISDKDIEETTKEDFSLIDDYSEPVLKPMTELSDYREYNISDLIYTVFQSYVYDKTIQQYQSGIWKLILLPKNKLIVFKEDIIEYETIFKRSCLYFKDLNVDNHIYELTESGVLKIITNPIASGEFLIESYNEGYPFSSQYFIDGADSIKVMNNLFAVTGVISDKSNFFVLGIHGETQYKNLLDYKENSYYGVTIFNMENQEVIRSFRYQTDEGSPIIISESGDNYFFTSHDERTQIIYTDNYQIQCFGGCTYKFYGNYVLFFPYMGYSCYNIFAIVNLNNKQSVDLYRFLKLKLSVKEFSQIEILIQENFDYNKNEHPHVLINVSKETLLFIDEFHYTLLVLSLNDIFEGSFQERDIFTA